MIERKRGSFFETPSTYT